MKFGVELPQHLGFAYLRDLAQGTEDLGLDSLWVRDHLIVSPFELEQFQQGYLEGGRRVVSGDYLGCVPTLAALATVTTRATIGTDILNIARRQPVDVANEIATIDQISGGRVILQGAVGHPMRDTQPLGIETRPRERGEMLEEAIQIIRALWSSDEPIDFQGKHYTLTQARIGSRPVQQLPPLWLGIAKTFKRVARYADGFTLSGSMFGGELGEFVAAVERIRGEAVAVGRDPDAIVPAARFAIVVDEERERAKARAEASWSALWRRDERWFRDQAGDPDDIAALIAPYVNAGAQHILVWPVPYANVDDTLQDIDLFAREVVPRLRETTVNVT